VELLKLIPLVMAAGGAGPHNKALVVLVVNVKSVRNSLIENSPCFGNWAIYRFKFEQ
jgi:hypothetical protein